MDHTLVHSAKRQGPAPPAPGRARRGLRLLAANRARLLAATALAAITAGGVLHLVGAGEIGHQVWRAAVALLAADLAFEVGRTVVVDRHLGVDAIALVAMVGALALGEELAGVVIGLMYTGGEALEAAASKRARRELTARAQAAAAARAPARADVAAARGQRAARHDRRDRRFRLDRPGGGRLATAFGSRVIATRRHATARRRADGAGGARVLGRRVALGRVAAGRRGFPSCSPSPTSSSWRRRSRPRPRASSTRRARLGQAGCLADQRRPRPARRRAGAAAGAARRAARWGRPRHVPRRAAAPGSPFYDLPNVIVTPHTSWSSGRVLDRSVELFCDNLRRYAAGEPLLNVVDPAAGY